MFERGIFYKYAAVSLILLKSCNITSANRIIYVDDDGPADFNNIQAAINDANDNDTILVADGTYTGNGNRDIDFYGKAITVKSENGNETCIIDCQGTEDEFHRGFYFHSSEGNGSVISGLTITGGASDNGAGIYIQASSPKIEYCNITENKVAVDTGSGGGLYAINSFAIISHCTVSGNSGSNEGGGIFTNNSSLTIIDSEIINNKAINTGGGIYCSYGRPSISNCEIKGNITDLQVGGGFACWASNPLIKNCIIADNIAGNKSNTGSGGGLSFLGSSVEINLCTIIGNTASNIGGGIHFNLVNATVNNCIIENNTGHNGTEIAVTSWSGTASQTDPPAEPHYNSFLTISYSNIKGGRDGLNVYYEPEWFSLNWGTGNIDTNSSFADPNNNDFHLKSQAGRWDQISQSWVQDDITSPCIDAGDPMTPISYEPFPSGGTINMGAYGGTSQASKSYFGKPLCDSIIAGDINGDCKVDSTDMDILLLHWLE
jgi:hypothetical protein